jgi:hypothetical protein
MAGGSQCPNRRVGYCVLVRPGCDERMVAWATTARVGSRRLVRLDPRAAPASLWGIPLLCGRLQARKGRTPHER